MASFLTHLQRGLAQVLTTRPNLTCRPASHLHTSGISQRFYNLLYLTGAEKSKEPQNKALNSPAKFAIFYNNSELTKKIKEMNICQTLLAKKNDFLTSALGQRNGIVKEVFVNPTTKKLMLEKFEWFEHIRENPPINPWMPQRSPPMPDFCCPNCLPEVPPDPCAPPPCPEEGHNPCPPPCPPVDPCNPCQPPPPPPCPPASCTPQKTASGSSCKSLASMTFQPYTEKAFFSTYGRVNTWRPNSMWKSAGNRNRFTSYQKMRLFNDVGGGTLLAGGWNIQNSSFHETALRNRRKDISKDGPINPDTKGIKKKKKSKKHPRKTVFSPKKTARKFETDENWKVKVLSDIDNPSEPTNKPSGSVKSSSGTYSSNEPLKRTYLTATPSFELKAMKSFAVPVRSLRSSKALDKDSRRDNEHEDRNNPKNKEAIFRREMEEIENCGKSTKCGKEIRNSRKKESDIKNIKK